MKIKDLTGQEIELNACMGCEIVNGNLSPFGGILYRNDHFLISQDFELPINGFIIISSVRHIQKFTDLTNEERINLGQLIDKTLSILRESNLAEEFNIILEEKSHFHVWLMPRHKWMLDKFGSPLKNIKAIQDYARENMRTEENFAKIASTCEVLKENLNME